MDDHALTRRRFLRRLGPAAMGALSGLAVLPRVLAAPAQQAAPSREVVHLADTAMGCRFEILLPEPERWVVEAARQALALASQLEAQLSIFRAASEVSQINRLAGYEPLRVEPGLFALLARCREWSARLEGAFDPAAGALTRCWREAARNGQPPSREEIAGRLPLVGMHQVHLGEADHTLRLQHPGVELDLGGVGKGYAVDRIVAELRARGVADALVHAGHSSIYALGSPPWEEQGWLVEVADPQGLRPALARLRLQDRAMSTSSPSFRQFTAHGKRWGHLLDPRTGWPAEQVLAVSALATGAAEAEALSTGLFVLGPVVGEQVLAQWGGAAALFVAPGTPEPTLVACGQHFEWEAMVERSETT